MENLLTYGEMLAGKGFSLDSAVMYSSTPAVDQKADVVEVQTITRKPLLELEETKGGGYTLPKDKPVALAEKKTLVRSLVGLTYRKSGCTT